MKKHFRISDFATCLIFGALLLNGCSESIEKVGGTRITLEALTDPPRVTSITPEILDKVENVLQSRAHTFAAHTVVKQKSKTELVVEMPGIAESPRLRETLAAPTLLEFKELIEMPDGKKVWKNTDVNSYDFKRATATPMAGGETWHVNFEFNEQGAAKFGALTKRLVGQQVGIFLDGVPTERGSDGLPLSTNDYHGVTVREEILGGHGEISGGFSKEQAVDLAIKLNSGSLPVPIKILEIEAVNPTEIGSSK